MTPENLVFLCGQRNQTLRVCVPAADSSECEAVKEPAGSLWASLCHLSS